MQSKSPQKKFTFKINGREHSVQVEKIQENAATLSINGRRIDLEIIPEKRLDLAPKLVMSQAIQVPVARQPVTASPGTSDISAITAPIPGNILQILVKPGDPVEVGQIVLKMEAMKMENDIRATSAGTVKEIITAVGANVLEGDILIKISFLDK